MKTFRFFLAILVVVLLSFGVQAQTSKSSSQPKAQQSSTKTKKPVDGRTKTGDKVNHALKGPNGETVYTGANGGNYYLTKAGNKAYLKK